MAAEVVAAIAAKGLSQPELADSLIEAVVSLVSLYGEAITARLTPPETVAERILDAVADDPATSYREGREMLRDSFSGSSKVGHLSQEHAQLMLEAYERNAQSTEDAVNRLVPSRWDRSTLARSFLIATIAAYSTGARDPKHLSRLQAQSMAAARAAKNKLPQSMVQRIVIETMDDNEIKEPSAIKRAEAALHAVNAKLAQEATNQGCKPTQYKSAKVLKSAYQRAKRVSASSEFAMSAKPISRRAATASAL